MDTWILGLWTYTDLLLLDIVRAKRREELSCFFNQMEVIHKENKISSEQEKQCLGFHSALTESFPAEFDNKTHFSLPPSLSVSVSLQHYWLFVLSRGLVGIGESSYSSISPTIIGDLFTNNSRTMMLSVFYLAIPLGR